MFRYSLCIFDTVHNCTRIIQLARMAVSKTVHLGSNPSSCVGWFGSIHPELINKTTEAFEKQKG